MQLSSENTESDLKKGTKTKTAFTKLSPHIRHFLFPYKKEICRALFFLILGASAVLSIGFGLRYFVDQGFVAEDPQFLKKGFALLILIGSALSIAAFFRVSTTSWLAEKVVSDLKQSLFCHLLKLDQSYYDRARTGDLIARFNSDTTVLLTLMTSSLATTVRSLVQLVGALVMLIITSPKLTGVVILVIPFVLSPIGALGRRVRRLTKTVQDSQGTLEALTTDYLQALQTVRLFAREKEVFNHFVLVLENKMTWVKKRIHLRAFLVGLVIFLAFSSVSLVMWLGSQEVLSDRLTPGDFSAFLFFALIAAGSLNALSDLLGDVQTAAGALERVVDVLETKPALTEPINPQFLPKSFNLPLVFHKVSFAYPTQDQVKILDDFELTIPPGQTVALVGASGAGKTTLFNLLLRFYDPLSGDILLGKTSLNAFSTKDRRSLFSVVPQDPVIFNASLKDNILFGADQTFDMPDRDIMSVLEKAALASFVKSLPDGLETMVGERGMRLSGGQKQRLALARAFLRRSPYLLLDEATNSLDSESEFQIQKALANLMRNKTTFVIAHRLSTVQNADQILVMEQGKLIERGTHADLLKQKGVYYKFAQHQLFVS